MSSSVLVVGSYVQDLTWRCREFPQAGETIIGTFVGGPGGKGSNQAVAAARAGAATCFIGAVGRDTFAADAKKFHGAEGIAARFIEKPMHATGTAGILVNASGQNEIVVALGANAALAPRDVPSALVRAARVVVCQHETNLALNAHVFRLARRAGVLAVLNPAPMRPDFDAAILAHTDVLIPNETEFCALVNRVSSRVLTEAQLAKLSETELHTLCRTLGVATVIVTLGVRGCLVSREPGHDFIPAHTGIKVVDTTGAGDAFVGGFVAGLVEFGGDQLRAARLANTVAALSVTKPGTAPSMPTRREIARFLRAAVTATPRRSG
jgi:ribokinase